MRKSFIWFDLGYTLVYQQREEAYRKYLLERGIDISIAEIERAYHLTDKLFMRQYPGALSKELTTFYSWYIGMLNYSLGVRFDLSVQCARLLQLQKEGGQGWRPFPFASSALSELKRNGYGLGLISNWDESCRTLLRNIGLETYFDEIVVSSEVELEKPDTRIFEHGLRAADVRPEECVYVGDNYYDDVVGSGKAGMDCFLINRFGRLGIEELQYEKTISSVQELPALLLKPEQQIIR
ncbi:HAD family hydrolase [Paenibacillus sp. NPDC058071]|uniref:HAD family hydrolase n=1 Tax=Paenibacillus sp. NPDC058071 TaxID=3346326 RepID=UPI0036DBBCBA